MRPVQLSSLKSELTDSSSALLSSSGWASKSANPKECSHAKNGKGNEGDGSGGLKPWAPTKRGVPGLNQPEPRGKEAFTDLGSARGSSQRNVPEDEAARSRSIELKRPSNPSQAAMLPSYMKPREEPQEKRDKKLQL